MAALTTAALDVAALDIAASDIARTLLPLVLIETATGMVYFGPEEESFGRKGH
jgi:hypothetical protein